MKHSSPLPKRFAAGASIAGLLASGLDAQQPQLTISPAQPSPGSIVRLAMAPPTGRDSIVALSGEMAGEPLHFRRGADGIWRAIGGVPVDAVGEVGALARIERASGVADTVRASVVLPRPTRVRRRPSALAVSSRFTRPLDSATQARVDRESEKARAIGRKAHDSPPMWTGSFWRPRASTVTSRFGSGRMFNGTLSSRHLGVDFRGAVGESVRAANDGVVALVDDFFLAGRVVYVDHGGGVVTGYFHLSEALVSTGDTVSRGQEVGRVGATGRVTAPHLHWTARYGTITVNPLDLVNLPRGG